MKIFVKGIGETNLTQRDFIAKGGEKSVYAKGNTGYAIYEDVKKMIPVGKIKELSVLDRKEIIRPEHLILNEKNVVIGHTMRFVKDTYALCQLFTKTFHQRNNVTHDLLLDLSKKLRDIVQFVHEKDILIVDLNELNFLITQKFDEVVAIDTNSYQTKNYPATAIMDSIRDRHNSKFSEGTDWFSWAVVTFQLLIGIHPYKGRHPKFESLDLDARVNARMEQNVSIFNKDVSVPKVCYPLDVIPNGLKQWFHDVFEKGLREPPPVDFDVAGVIAAKIKQVVGSNLLIINKIYEIKEIINKFYASDRSRVLIGNSTIEFNNRTYGLPNKDCHVVFTPKMGTPIVAFIENSLVKLVNPINGTALSYCCNAENLMESNGRLYIKNGIEILELKFIEFGNDIVASSQIVGQVLDMPGATRLFEGVIIQNMIGRWVASIFPIPGHCYQINIQELDGVRIIDAKFENNVLVIIGVNSGKYDRYVFRFYDNYQKYNLRKVENVDYSGINFTVGDNGICLLMTEDEKLEIFRNDDSTSLKILDDPAISNDMRLCHEGSTMMFYKGKELFEIKMNKGK